MLVIFVVALFFTWFANEVQHARREAIVISDLINAPSEEVTYDYQVDHGKFISKPPAPAWLRSICGDNLFATVTGVWLLYPTSRQIVQLRAFPRLQRIVLDQPDISDCDLSQLVGVKEINDLSILHGECINNRSLKAISELDSLESLTLNHCPQISADCLVPLLRLGKLTSLDLYGCTKIDDSSLEVLKRFTGLRTICIRGTNITLEVEQSLEETLPNIKFD